MERAATLTVASILLTLVVALAARYWDHHDRLSALLERIVRLELIVEREHPQAPR